MMRIPASIVITLTTTTEPTALRREEEDDEDSKPVADDEDTGAQVASIVQLQEVAVTTGVENEDVLLELALLECPIKQALAHVTAQAALSQSYMQMHAELQRSFAATTTEPLVSHSSPTPSETLTEQMNPASIWLESSKIESGEVSQSDKKAAYVTTGDKPASEGYNGRKYEQKHVKASECPQSYYKWQCTY